MGRIGQDGTGQDRTGRDIRWEDGGGGDMDRIGHRIWDMGYEIWDMGRVQN